jgi:hypothetical protein
MIKNIFHQNHKTKQAQKKITQTKNILAEKIKNKNHSGKA